MVFFVPGLKIWCDGPAIDGWSTPEWTLGNVPVVVTVLKSSHKGPQPWKGFFRRWFAPCGWSRAYWWVTSWWGCSRVPQCHEGWPYSPDACAGTSASAPAHTRRSSSWPCSVWAQWSNPSRSPRSPQWAGSGNSGTPWSVRHSPGQSLDENVLDSQISSLRGRVALSKRVKEKEWLVGGNSMDRHIDDIQASVGM